MGTGTANKIPSTNLCTGVSWPRTWVRMRWLPILDRMHYGTNQVILRHQKFTFSRVSGASERANGRASGPVLTSRFLFVPDHSAVFIDPLRRDFGGDGERAKRTLSRPETPLGPDLSLRGSPQAQWGADRGNFQVRDSENRRPKENHEKER